MDVQAGIYVTIVGMALVFSALAIIMLAIMALKRFFGPGERARPSVAATGGNSEEETAIVAAIAVALSLASSEEAGRHAPQPIHVLSIRRETGAWKAYSQFHPTE